MPDHEYEGPKRRPLVILLADITATETLPANISPLEAWSFYDVDVYALDYYRGAEASPAWGGAVQGVGTRINTLSAQHNASVTLVIGVGGGAAVGLRALQLHVTSPSAFVGLNGAYNLNKTDELSDEVVSAFNLFCSGSNEPDRIVAAYTQQMSCEGKENKVPSLFMATETSTEISTEQSTRMDEDALIIKGKTQTMSVYDGACFPAIVNFMCDANTRALTSG